MLQLMRVTCSQRAAEEEESERYKEREAKGNRDELTFAGAKLMHLKWENNSEERKCYKVMREEAFDESIKRVK